MKPINNKTLFALLLLLAGFFSGFAQTSGTPSLPLPFAQGTNLTAYTQYYQYGATFTGFAILVPTNATGMPVPVYLPINSSLINAGPIWCDSYPPPCGPDEITIQTEMDNGLVLVINGISASSLPSGMTTGSTMYQGQYLGTVGSSGKILVNVYDPGTAGVQYDANGNLVRDWVVKKVGRQKFVTDSHSQEVNFCDGTMSGPLYNGQNLTVAGCTSFKMGDQIVNEASTAKVYPQPACDQLNFSWENSKAEAVKIELMDAKGRIIKTLQAEGKQTQLSTSGFENGVYFYRLSGHGIKESGKFMIVH
ncbi:MAG: T9SS type A sorting domain-containing protein [Bacteroidia bacterium]|nr:T9SS type A sorting domain-containing protein [Bacteroidia bacterium]